LAFFWDFGLCFCCIPAVSLPVGEYFLKKLH
jgi:hypothetical protein